MSVDDVDFYVDHCSQKELVDLHRKVFGSDMDIDFWNWKYPYYSKPNSVYARYDNKVIGFYGLISRKLKTPEIDIEGFQVSDVMVDKTMRGGINSSLMKLLFDNVSDSIKKSLLFGFPHKKHYFLGERLGIYNLVKELSRFDICSDSNNSAFKKTDLSDFSLADYCFYLEKFFISVKRNNLSFFERSYSYAMNRFLYNCKFDYEVFISSDCCFFLKCEGSDYLVMDYLGDVDCFFDNAYKLSGSISKFPVTISGWTAIDEDDVHKFGGLSLKKSGAFFCYFTNGSGKINTDTVSYWITMGDTDFL